MSIKKTKERVLEQLKQRNLKYSIIFPADPNFNFEGNLQKIDWKCEKGHIFSAIIKNVLKGCGCRKCSTKNYIPFEEIIKRFDKRNKKYPEKKVRFKDIFEYLGIKKHMTFICEKDHEWSAIVSTVLSGTYCSICTNITNGINQTYSITTIRKKLEQHNLRFPAKRVYIYNSDNYCNKKDPLELTCDNEHIWTTKVDNIMSKHSGCPVCAQTHYSLKAINYFEGIMKKENIFIRHAMNKGEILIPGTRYRADGYCEETNTIYEFYGDEFHGNPYMFDPNGYNTLCKKTYGELYDYTMKREIEIKKLGYNLKTIWEEDYDNILIYNKQFDQLVIFLTSLGCEVELNTDFGIVIKEFGIAINLCGLKLYTHIKIKKIDYHKEMYKLAKDQGLRLITIFSDEWKSNKIKVKDTLRYFVHQADKGIAGRKCIIEEVTWKVAKPFLNKYHLLNAGSSNKINLGAFDGKKLIAVMTFGKSNIEYGQCDYYEMTRFVTDKKTHPGLASKMFKHAVNVYSFTKVIAFVDKRWFLGEFKALSGFNVVSETKPTKWYTDGQKRYHRRFITKKQLLNEYNILSTVSKDVAMFSLGYKPIYDCGKLKLEWVAS